MAEMPSPARITTLLQNLTTVTQRIEAVSSGRPIRLILVSKLKPASDILALHTSPPHPSHFGENYVQELQQKAALLPASLNWHFIGGLQSNKCRALAQGIRNLYCVSSVDSARKADELEKGRAALRAGDPAAEALRILVQVNTSGEAAKSGVEPGEALGLCAHVREMCPNLRLAGLMTIGAIARSMESGERGENEDFEALRRVRGEVANGLGVEEGELQLSMGMSADFEAAIRQGSDEVRIGSTIFGERPPRSEATV